jgi:hypothetical protein
MNKVLKDPLAVKNAERGQVFKKGPLPLGEFKAPSYDNRTSCSVSAGDDYGIGHRQPIGKEKASPMTSGPIPQSAHAFSPDKIFDDKTPEDQKG